MTTFIFDTKFLKCNFLGDEEKAGKVNFSSFYALLKNLIYCILCHYDGLTFLMCKILMLLALNFFLLIFQAFWTEDDGWSFNDYYCTKMGKTANFAKFSNIFEFSQNKSKDAIFAIFKYLNVRAKNHKMQFLPFIPIF